MQDNIRRLPDGPEDKPPTYMRTSNKAGTGRRSHVHGGTQEVTETYEEREKRLAKAKEKYNQRVLNRKSEPKKDNTPRTLKTKKRKLRKRQ